MAIRFFEQTYSLLVSSGDTGGVLAALEVAGPGGATPPVHVHQREDEAFYVLEGEYSIVIGDDHVEASPGTWVWGPRGVPHGYRIRSEHGRHLSLVVPGGFEAFFEEAAELATPATDPGTVIGRIAEIAAGYGVQFVGPSGDPR